MKNDTPKKEDGFTLIETLVAISLLMLALIAPMSLAAQSLAAAYYSRSQITAFYLAQEGIEVVRSVRDANILADADTGSNGYVFNGIPYSTTPSNATPFTVDSLQATGNALYTCAANGCPPVMTNGSLYGYDDNGNSIGSDCPHVEGSWSSSVCQNGDGWTTTTFTRTVKAYLINPSNPNELRVSVTVTWVQGTLRSQKFTINEDLYAWLSTGGGGGSGGSGGSACTQNSQCQSGICGNGVCQSGL